MCAIAVENDSIFAKNMEILSEAGPDIYDKIKNPEVTGYGFEMGVTRNELVNIKVNMGNRKAFLHSNYNPFIEAERIDHCSPDDDIDTIVILGFGLGYHIEYLIDRYPYKNKIVIEPDERLFSTCLKARAYKSILKADNVKLILSDNAVSISMVLGGLCEEHLMSKVKFIALPSYLEPFREFWISVQEEFLSVYRGIVMNFNTNKFFKFTWTESIFKNVFHLSDSAIINDFRGKFKSLPGIVVASGPSLNENVHFLKKLKDKALIVAAGSSINSLLYNGVVPHIMLGLDGGEIMSRMYNKVDRDDILFAYILNVHYDCLNKYKGPKLFFHTTAENKARGLAHRLGLNTSNLIAGASCANVATDFLYTLGCDPIIFIGQDLCYYKTKTHALGVIEHDDLSEDDDSDNYIKTEDMDGNPVRTIIQHLDMKYWFETYFMLRKGKRTFINATARGLPLEGTVRMSIEEVAEKYCSREVSFEKKIKQLFKKSVNKSNIDKEKISDLLMEVKAEALKVTRWSKKRINLVYEIQESLKVRDVSKQAVIRVKVNKVTEKLENSWFFKEFIWMGNCDDLIIIKNKAEMDAAREKELVKKLEILYKGLESQFGEVLLRTLYIRKLIGAELKKYRKGRKNGQ